MAFARQAMQRKPPLPAERLPETPQPAAAPSNAFDRMMRAARSDERGGDTAAGGNGGAQSGGGGKRAAAEGEAGKAKPARRWGGMGGMGGTGGGKRGLAPYKRIEGTHIIVDGFTVPPSTGDMHFLTHFHADHYIGLNKRWSCPVYCSAVTARLVTRQLGISPHLLRILPLDTPTELPAALGGGRVTPIDANHCPGAVILLFELADGRLALHTGDFRYLPSMASHVTLARRELDLLYLDTTYSEPQYTFPTQQAVVAGVVEQCRLLQASLCTLMMTGDDW